MPTFTIALVLLPFLAVPLLAQDGERGGRLLTDFQPAGRSLEWFSVNDGVMGGRSRGSFRIEGGILEFAGSLNTNGGGFASIRTQPAELALAEAEGVRLRVRGDGRVYTMRLEQRGGSRGRSTSYRAEFETVKGGSWQDVWLPFDSFVPVWRGRTLDLPAVDPARVVGLGLMISDKIDGVFHLEVDAIHTYAPFSLQDYRGEQRLMAVFAPGADDDRVGTLVAAIGESQVALRDRDTVSIVVIEDGASFAGSRPLSADAVRALRRALDVPAGEFAIKLIGEDGGVKRSMPEPAPLAALLGQIDQMSKPRSGMEERLGGSRSER